MELGECHLRTCSVGSEPQAILQGPCKATSWISDTLGGAQDLGQGVPEGDWGPRPCTQGLDAQGHKAKPVKVTKAKFASPAHLSPLVIEPEASPAHPSNLVTEPEASPACMFPRRQSPRPALLACAPGKRAREQPCPNVSRATEPEASPARMCPCQESSRAALPACLPGDRARGRPCSHVPPATELETSPAHLSPG